MIWIRRQWNDPRSAEVQFEKLERPHWSYMSGGVRRPSPRPFVYGYVWCNDVVGEIGHSCTHGEGPHRIKVCVVKKDNSKEVCSRLLAIVSPKP